ncbi:Double-stranded RNA-binding protein 1 [Citrus sinensis]|uniref:Double-stranded RNA-binding protein 1 n=1 Tax=Citrus sinensis TaxID=2711 RepID=A0ACB8KP58_CITSI|nr:Double-stranded RNA-binding protein 1 [Citrus sinensis]
MGNNILENGVSNCYVFKSRLQEYAQKAGIPTPVYETIKEGPSHEPWFRSTVIVDDVRYDSLPGFFNRKAAEQSAAEVALVELAKLGKVNECISQPICRKDEASGKVQFSCTVEIGDIRYIGGAAKTKKEAEIKAARTALLAIQSSASELSGNSAGNTQLTVLPSRKRGPEVANNPEETVNVPKAKKGRFKKKILKMKRPGGRMDRTQLQNTGNMENINASQEGSKVSQANTSGIQGVSTEVLAVEGTMDCQEGRSEIEPIEREMPAVNDALPHHIGGDSETIHSAATHCSDRSSNEASEMGTSSLAKEVNEVTPGVGTSSVSCHTTALAKEVNEGTPNEGTSTALTEEVNEPSGIMEAASMTNNSTLGQIESSCVIPGINQPEERIQAGTSQA